ncbi:MmcQ/YjbR family DNA-binding protein [Vagococcus sp. BWB3-3]|uniref:MmcQ/YjbR family DNA-binding protein n=1 Tax=Vagococcus allomyrinae TaxID=2794353 RepID=A0A940SWE2_9ENTE|nr:MmcQ/YjbR family DNA-binding protein [Vagococcus allomyrinae]MBP1042899.1 MmcQ/YjbR family DNA-binding protein [Vagococcus allomyrinae]
MEEIAVYLKKASNSWPGATVRYRDDWEVDYFSVADKCFALLGVHHEWGPQLIVKGLPEYNEELREIYDFIVPGYHMNKTHWNSIILNKSSLSDEELVALLKRSYELVVSKLPKSQQKLLETNS